MMSVKLIARGSNPCLGTWMESGFMIKLEMKARGLSGSSIIDMLRRGHMVRRAAWQDGYLVRICNEKGFDQNGLVIFDEKDNLYTICTDGYFLHLASSSQPFREPRMFWSAGCAREACRDGEGIGMLFADDWEDYGFITKKDFDVLTNELKDILRKKRERIINRAKNKLMKSKKV